MEVWIPPRSSPTYNAFVVIFKKQIPNEILFDLLKSICTINNNKYYIFNNDSFKKGIFTEEINKFIEICKPYYHNSKQKYLNKIN